jgi:hypothetical protein
MVGDVMRALSQLRSGPAKVSSQPWTPGKALSVQIIADTVGLCVIDSGRDGWCRFRVEVNYNENLAFAAAVLRAEKFLYQQRIDVPRSSLIGSSLMVQYLTVTDADALRVMVEDSLDAFCSP